MSALADQFLRNNRSLVTHWFAESVRDFLLLPRVDLLRFVGSARPEGCEMGSPGLRSTASEREWHGWATSGTPGRLTRCRA